MEDASLVGLHRTSRERGLALVLIGSVDRRVLPALTLAPQLATCEARALHVCLDAEQANHVATSWMDLALDWLPLRLEDPVGGTLAGSVRSVVQQEVALRPYVTVIVPEIDLGRWWQPLLHRGTGRHIAWHLHGLPRVTTVVLPVRTELESPRRVERQAPLTGPR